MKNISARISRPRVVLVNRALVLNEENKILLIRRSDQDEYMPGKWELPGGKLEAGQDISNALEREVLEETGLSVLLIDKIVYFHSETLSSGKYRGFPYIVLFGLAKNIGGKVSLSVEHCDFKWVSKEESLKYDLVHETRAALTVLIEKIH